jgi:hypothetical protein
MTLEYTKLSRDGFSLRVPCEVSEDSASGCLIGWFRTDGAQLKDTESTDAYAQLSIAVLNYTDVEEAKDAYRDAVANSYWTIRRGSPNEVGSQRATKLWGEVGSRTTPGQRRAVIWKGNMLVSVDIVVPVSEYPSILLYDRVIDQIIGSAQLNPVIEEERRVVPRPDKTGVVQRKAMQRPPAKKQKR